MEITLAHALSYHVTESRKQHLKIRDFPIICDFRQHYIRIRPAAPANFDCGRRARHPDGAPSAVEERRLRAGDGVVTGGGARGDPAGAV